MISENQIVHCKEILCFLDNKSIYSLKDTITKGLIVVSTREEAVNVIVEYSNNVKELLNRKKLSKENIFKYLYKKGVRVDPSCSKESAVQLVLKHINGSDEVSASPSQPCTSHSSNEQFSSAFYRHQVASDVAEADQLIAKEFVAWFYPMLNSLSGSAVRQSEWSEKHFWPDCTLKCKLPGGGGPEGDHAHVSEAFQGATLSQQRLASFVTDLNFLFNVNVTPNGYRGKISEHGLAKVAACGTVHRLSDVGPHPILGVFEQVFGLLRDPHDENRWKIKFTDLSINLVASEETIPVISNDTEMLIFNS